MPVIPVLEGKRSRKISEDCWLATYLQVQERPCVIRIRQSNRTGHLMWSLYMHTCMYIQHTHRNTHIHMHTSQIREMRETRTRPWKHILVCCSVAISFLPFSFCYRVWTPLLHTPTLHPWLRPWDFLPPSTYNFTLCTHFCTWLWGLLYLSS